MLKILGTYAVTKATLRCKVEWFSVLPQFMQRVCFEFCSSFVQLYFSTNCQFPIQPISLSHDYNTNVSHQKNNPDNWVLRYVNVIIFHALFVLFQCFLTAFKKEVLMSSVCYFFLYVCYSISPPIKQSNDSFTGIQIMMSEMTTSRKILNC